MRLSFRSAQGDTPTHTAQTPGPAGDRRRTCVRCCTLAPEHLPHLPVMSWHRQGLADQTALGHVLQGSWRQDRNAGRPQGGAQGGPNSELQPPGLEVLWALATLGVEKRHNPFVPEHLTAGGTRREHGRAQSLKPPLQEATGDSEQNQTPAQVQETQEAHPANRHDGHMALLPLVQ